MKFETEFVSIWSMSGQWSLGSTIWIKNAIITANFKPVKFPNTHTDTTPPLLEHKMSIWNWGRNKLKNWKENLENYWMTKNREMTLKTSIPKINRVCFKTEQRIFWSSAVQIVGFLNWRFFIIVILINVNGIIQNIDY